MARVVPSQIVAFIDAAFKDAKEFQDSLPSRVFILYHQHLGFARGLSDLLHNLDDSLLPQSDDYVTFVVASSAIRAKLEAWTRGDTTVLDKTHGYKENPVILIRRVLEKCPDSVIPTSISGLEFIKDPVYRESLRLELASVGSLFKAQEWKATMVLAGSLIEALLCYKIVEKTPRDIEVAVSSLHSQKNIKISGYDPLKWHLPAYVNIALELNLISNKTKEQALLSGDFRNLVHPGKSLREKALCNRAATYSVLAGLEHIIDDLMKRHTSV